MSATEEVLFDTTPYTRKATELEIQDITLRIQGSLGFNSRNLSPVDRDLVENARPGYADTLKVYGHWVQEQIGVSYDRDGAEVPKLAVSFRVESIEAA